MSFTAVAAHTKLQTYRDSFPGFLDGVARDGEILATFTGTVCITGKNVEDVIN